MAERPRESARPKSPRESGDRSSTAKDRTSPEALERAALQYLERYDASVAQLRKVLLRRIDRHAESDERERVTRFVDELLQRYVGSRLLDDARYAEHFVRSQRERGASTLKIRQKLRQRGIASETIDRVLERARETLVGGRPPEEAELDAARAYVRRRRLTERYDLTQPKERQKALAALARQGFSFELATRALGAPRVDEFDEP